MDPMGNTKTTKDLVSLGIQSYCQNNDWGIQSPPKSIVFNVFRFHYHSQKVIGSLWFHCSVVIVEVFFCCPWFDGWSVGSLVGWLALMRL